MVNQNIKIIDEESKLVNWKRLDYILIRLCRSTLIVGATIFALALVYKGLSWFMGV